VDTTVREGVLRFRSGRAENGGSREPERSVLKYVSTGSEGNLRSQAGIT